jgi:hypothetical protein
MAQEPAAALTRKLEALWRKADAKTAWAAARKAMALMSRSDASDVELEALGYLDAIGELCRETHGRLPETPHDPKPA